MKHTIRYRTAAIALAGLSSVGALGLLGTSATAQTGTTTATTAATTAPAASSSTTDTKATREAAHQAQRDADLTDMAARLGVSKEKLIQALKDQAKADVDKALAAGKITAAEATERKAAIDAGTGGKGGHGGRGGRGRGKPDGTDSTTRPTAAERKAERDARDAELAARLGVTKEKLVQARKDQAKAKVDARVAAGELTPEQGATVKQAIDQDIPGFGGPGGGDGGGPGGGGPGGGHRDGDGGGHDH